MSNYDTTENYGIIPNIPPPPPPLPPRIALPIAAAQGTGVRRLLPPGSSLRVSVPAPVPVPEVEEEDEEEEEDREEEDEEEQEEEET